MAYNTKNDGYQPFCSHKKTNLLLAYTKQILGKTHFFNRADGGTTKEPTRNFRRLTPPQHHMPQPKM